MVAIVKRRKGGRFFYYLKHTSTSRQRETYLGRSIPENIRELKEKFMLEFYRQEWQSDLEAISKGYKAELKRTPRNVPRGPSCQLLHRLYVSYAEDRGFRHDVSRDGEPSAARWFNRLRGRRTRGVRRRRTKEYSCIF